MKIGLEVFLEKEFSKFRSTRLGILCNQASVDKNLTHISQRVVEKKLRLNVTCFFGPQHGIRGEKQDNMVESEDFTHPGTSLPVFSLYSHARIPTKEMFDHLDTLLIDLQDIGTRIYTFIYTMANSMKAAKKFGKKIVVLDRPNPINGIKVEGNVLDPAFSSFVGQFPLPTRHGMTLGELAIMFNEAFCIGCNLSVIRLKGWKRTMFAEQWGRHWVPPSPNIPTPASALVFPGTVLFEGTNVSEGRGTTRPFEWIGAPYIDPDRLSQLMNIKKIPGVYFRPIFFQPTFQKHTEQICGGVHIHVTDPKRFPPVRVGLELLSTIAREYPGDFRWKEPPYEYEHDRMPIDLIAGTSLLRETLQTKKEISTFIKTTSPKLAQFMKLRRKYLLY